MTEAQDVKQAADKQGAKYLLANYTDAESKTVLVLGFHVSDLAEVLARRFPKNAAAREPISAYTGIECVHEWFKGKNPVRVGDTLTENINQGDRVCTIIAVDETTGEYLYEYSMPAGSSAIRRQDGGTIAYRSLSKRWLRLIEEQTGIDSLLAEPQRHSRSRQPQVTKILREKLNG